MERLTLPFEGTYSWNQLLLLFLLIFFRLGPLVAFTPFMGGKLLPMNVRAGLLCLLSLIFVPIAAQGGPIPEMMSDPRLILISMKELLIGFLLAFIASIPFYTAQSTGITIDFLRGSSQLMAQDPSLQNQSSPIGILYNYILIVLFFHFKGPFLFFETLADSYRFIPLFDLDHFFIFRAGFLKTVFPLFNLFFSTSLRLAAPSILAILMAEVFLGIVNRLAPQIQISFLGMALKSFLGLLLLFLSWFFVLEEMKRFSIETLPAIENNLIKKEQLFRKQPR